MAKDPSFPFYASDWLGSTKRALMTPSQRAAYVDLLCHQWGDPTCSLPDDDDQLAALSGLGEGWLNGGSRLLRVCFPKHPTLEGRIANERLTNVRLERDEWRKKSAEGGRKSGEVRRLRSANQSRTKPPTKHEPNANSPSPSPSPSKKKETPIVPFEEIDFPDGFDTPAVRQAIQDWLAHKARRGERYKKPAKQMGILLRQDWAISPDDFVAAVKHSTAQDYKGLYPPKDRKHGHSRKAVDSPTRVRQRDWTADEG